MNRERLFNILALRRKHDSAGEDEMIKSILDPYIGRTLAAPDGEVLAYVCTIPGPNDTASRTLFSSHIDTVVVGPIGLLGGGALFNQILFNEEKQTLHGNGNTLGADDGAGVWLLLEMIDAGVPGTYMFHRGEECGGIGSSGIAKHHYKFLQCFDRAIAFDRRGTHSVITHQGSARCCSEDFATALAYQLTTEQYFYSGDDSGSFTDTKNYVDDIPECTNVSVGYDSEHGTNESLDLTYLFSLRDQCITLAWETLPTVRKAGDVEYLPWQWGGRKAGGVTSIRPALDDYDDLTDYYGALERQGSQQEAMMLYSMSSDQLVEYVTPMRYAELLDFCEEYPEYAADLIQDLLYATWAAQEVDDEQSSGMGV